MRDESIPFHRLLSARGLVDGYYRDKLIAERHKIVETSTGKWQVVDYKNTIVDVSKLKVPAENVALGTEFVCVAMALTYVYILIDIIEEKS